MAKTVKSAGAAAAQKSGKSMENANATKSTKKSAVTTNAPKIDHINIFEYYENKPLGHEDTLTRSFLALANKVHAIRKIFFKSLRREDSKIPVKSRKIRIFTQVDYRNMLFKTPNDKDYEVISILMTDAQLPSSDVAPVDRQARYDGVILFEDKKKIFIIENKPSNKNVNPYQLSPNKISVGANNKVREKSCTLHWNSIIDEIGNKQPHIFGQTNRELVSDFLEYVNCHYDALNPYNTFAKCNNSLDRVKRRCRDILNKYAEDNGSTVKHHKAWQDFVQCVDKKTTLNEIPLIAKKIKDDEWVVTTDLYLANTTKVARKFYKIPNLKDKLAALENTGYTIKPCLHLGYIQSVLCRFQKLSDDWQNYVKHWSETEIEQVKKNDFKKFINDMQKENIVIDSSDVDLFSQEVIEGTKYDHFDIRPDLLVSYTWSKKDAEKLDKNEKFVEDFNKKVEAVKKILGI